MKNYGGIIKLTGLIVLLPLLVWLFALKETAALYSRKQKLQKENNEIRLVSMGNKKMAVAKSLGVPLLSNGKILQTLEEDFKGLGLCVVHYSPQLVDERKGDQLYAAQLVICGQYIQLVRILLIMEQMEAAMKVVSVDFEKEHPNKDTSSIVQMTVQLLQMEYSGRENP